MSTYEQEIQVLGENVIWLNKFFEELFVLMRNIARVIKDQGIQVKNQKYWHPTQAQGPNRFSIPAFYVLYMGGEEFVYHIYSLLDPSYLRLSFLKRKP